MTQDQSQQDQSKIVKRFRGYLPIVIDVETAGFNPEKDALLELAMVILGMDKDGKLYRKKTAFYHIVPFEGANLDQAALEFTGIDPYHPFRFAKNEKVAFKEMFDLINKEIKLTGCQKAILVGHNSAFDLSFVKACAKRCHFKRTPFHPFSTLDTVSLSALALGQTVLAKAVQAANMPFNHSEAHSAIYDAEITADLFCFIVNRWHELGGWSFE